MTGIWALLPSAGTTSLPASPTCKVRELVEKAPAPIQWLVFDAEAIGDLDLSAAQTIHSLLEDLNRKGVRAVFGRDEPKSAKATSGSRTV